MRKTKTADCSGRRYFRPRQYASGMGIIRENISAFSLSAVFLAMMWLLYFCIFIEYPDENNCEKKLLTDFYYIEDSRGYVLFDKTTGESYDLHDLYEANPYWTVCFGAPGYMDITDFLDNTQTVCLWVFKGAVMAIDSDPTVPARDFSWWFLGKHTEDYVLAFIFAGILPAWFIEGVMVHITSRRSTSRKPLRETARNLSRPNMTIEY